MPPFTHLRWPFHGFETASHIGYTGVRADPVKLLRYWFGRLLLERLHASVGTPLSVLEVGIGGGQMLGFMGGARHGDTYALPHWIARWDALDVQAAPAVLERYSYSDYFEADVEAPLDLKGRRYHAVIFIHVLEHLFKPEQAMLQCSKHLTEHGLLIGGSPTMPSLLAVAHEPWLQFKHRDVINDVKIHRHISVITPRRVRRFAHRHHFQIELIAGTFFCRWSGFILEDTKLWLQANLAWGALFPSLGGELYFALRK